MGGGKPKRNDRTVVHRQSDKSHSNTERQRQTKGEQLEKPISLFELFNNWFRIEKWRKKEEEENKNRYNRRKKERRHNTWAAALKHAGVSHTLGASWALLRGHKAAKTTIMTSRIKMNTNNSASIKSPREVTPNRPPAFWTCNNGRWRRTCQLISLHHITKQIKRSAHKPVRRLSVVSTDHSFVVVSPSTYIYIYICLLLKMISNC